MQISGYWGLEAILRRHTFWKNPELLFRENWIKRRFLFSTSMLNNYIEPSVGFFRQKS
jgi:hypothetical protein